MLEYILLSGCGLVVVGIWLSLGIGFQPKLPTTDNP